MSVNPWSAQIRRPVPKHRTARSNEGLSALILDRDFDRHRLVDLEADGNQDGNDDEGDKRFLHMLIIPAERKVMGQASLGLLSGGPVACGLWIPP